MHQLEARAGDIAMEDEELRKGREDEKLGRMKRRREVGGGR